MSAVMFKKLGVAAATGLVLAQGCRYSDVNTQHCNYNDGDAYCAAQYPDGSRPYCESGLGECVSPGSGEHGCVAERPANECYSPCGERSTIDENGACVMVEDSSTGTSSGSATDESSSSESSTTGPMPCLGNEDCPDAAAPFCEPVSGECVACDGTDDPDGACAGIDPGLPLCVGGACVACTAENPAACTGLTPICDDATNTCVPCTEHGQCGEAACNLFTGACLPADAVVHVGAGQDFSTIGAAVDSFDVMTEGTIIVHGGDYNESVTVDGSRVLAFLAAELGPKVEPPRWIRSAGTLPQLTVADATVLMDGLQVSGNQSSTPPGLRVDGGRAWVDRSRIVGNDGGGIVAESAAELVLRNCFVGDGNTNSTDAITITGATLTMLYTTAGAAANTGMAARALYCDGGGQADVRNSILVSFDAGPAVECPGLTIADSATETELGMLSSTWFEDYGTGDFHLTMSAPIAIANAARWETGDPPTDIDGDPRPAVDGSPDYAGADALP